MTSIRVIKGINRRSAAWLKWLSLEEMKKKAKQKEEKYGIPAIWAGIDGCLVRFDGVPRGGPKEHELQSYWCRKQFFGLN